MPKEEKEEGKEKCYFSTFIDEVTITCSPDGEFDSNGWPVKGCPKLPSCGRIKEMNKGSVSNKVTPNICKIEK